MVYMYHSFLIHSSADGHLGCFHVLAIINSAVMNIGVHMSLSDLPQYSRLENPMDRGAWWAKVHRVKKSWTPLTHTLDFPGSPVVKNPPANAGDTGLIPGPGRSHTL